MPWRQRVLLILLLLLAALALLWAFLPRPVPVETVKASRGPLRVTVEEEGKTRLRDRFVVSAPVAGYVRRVDLDVGDAVKRGQAVAGIDPVRAEGLDPRTRAIAQARVSTAEAALRTAAERVREAQASDEYASARYERTRRLADAGLTPKDALEQAASEAKRASAAARSAVEAEDGARHDLEAAKAALTGAGAFDGRRADQVTVRSPVTGKVLAVRHESEGVVPAGTPLLEVGDPGRLEVEVDVLSADAVRIRPGTPVLFERWGGDVPLEGKVRVVEPVGFTKVSALGVEEQRVLVLVDITSPRDVWKGVGDGYRLEASFILWEEKDVLQVPAGALFRTGDQSAVYIVEKGRAKARPVEIGRRNGLAAQLLSGLKEGETVILHPGDTVEDGKKVRARETTPPRASQ
ncbi:MAG: efflux RND transporter periplasmic adaptor subunit [bacterium]|jgi:HlyD family secretion protein